MEFIYVLIFLGSTYGEKLNTRSKCCALRNVDLFGSMELQVYRNINGGGTKRLLGIWLWKSCGQQMFAIDSVGATKKARNGVVIAKGEDCGVLVL